MSSKFLPNVTPSKMMDFCSEWDHRLHVSTYYHAHRAHHINAWCSKTGIDSVLARKVLRKLALAILEAFQISNRSKITNVFRYQSATSTMCLPCSHQFFAIHCLLTSFFSMKFHKTFSVVLEIFIKRFLLYLKKHFSYFQHFLILSAFHISGANNYLCSHATVTLSCKMIEFKLCFK